MIKKSKPEPNAVAYLLFYILMFLFIFGIIYNVLSDIRDFLPPIFYSLSAMTEYGSDADFIWGWDTLNFLLSFSVTFGLVGLMWFVFEMSQKPQQPWG